MGRGYPKSPLLFNYATEDVLQNDLFGYLGSGFELLPENGVFELEYADDVNFFCDNGQTN